MDKLFQWRFFWRKYRTASIFVLSLVMAVVAIFLPRISDDCPTYEDYIQNTLKLTSHPGLSTEFKAGSIIQIAGIDDEGQLKSLDIPRVVVQNCFVGVSPEVTTVLIPTCVSNERVQLGTYALKNAEESGSVAELMRNYQVLIKNPHRVSLNEQNLKPTPVCLKALNDLRLPYQTLRAVTEIVLADGIKVDVKWKSKGSVEALTKIVESLGFNSSSFKSSPISGQADTAMILESQEPVLLGYRSRDLVFKMSASPASLSKLAKMEER